MAAGPTTHPSTRSLTQAHMTYQAFVLELPLDRVQVVQAEIIDSNGRVILSIG